MSDDIAINCTNDIVEKLKDTGAFGGKGQEKVFSVYSEKDLFDKTKHLSFPAVGVMYEGIFENGGDKSNQGMAAMCAVTIVLLLDGKTVGNLDQKNVAAALLDKLRGAIRLQRSPSMHRWKFIAEIPAGEIGPCIGYLQKWRTPVILTN
jgi:hypothetical protein